MNYIFNSGLFALLLLLTMMLMLEIGRRIALRRRALDPEGAHEGISALEGAIFGLMGLLFAFTFSGAATRFDARRQLVVQESNDIGTAYLRVDLLPAAVQPAMRELFRRYLDARLAAYRGARSYGESLTQHQRSVEIQGEIWSLAVNSTRENVPQSTTMLLLPALNTMFDTGTSQLMAGRMHPPAVVYIMLGVLTLASSLLAGYDVPGGKKRSWIHTLSFAGIMAVSVYVILDLEFPRLGLIRIDAFDQALIDLRASMK